VAFVDPWKRSGWHHCLDRSTNDASPIRSQTNSEARARVLHNEQRDRPIDSFEIIPNGFEIYV